MCGQLTEELPGEPRAARHGRNFVAAACATWMLGEVRDDLVLPVSELVTNAVLHAGTDVRLTISLTRHFVEVAIGDRNPRPPIVRPVRLDLEADLDAIALVDGLLHDQRDPALAVGEAGAVTAGRGLHIVDAVADEWGVAELTDGKDVWFRVRTPTDWQPRTGCACNSGSRTSPGGLRMSLSPAYDI